ncbi:MAG: hypothetical protein ACXIU5_09475 [Halomonadaceae bacterium]|jgi:chromosome segregation ATPase
MSIESLRSRIAQLEKDKARLESQLSRERENARKKQAEITQIARSINKNTSASSLSSKQRQIESKQRQLSNYEKKAADLQGKLAAKNTDILRKLNEVESAEKQSKRRRDQEEKSGRINSSGILGKLQESLKGNRSFTENYLRRRSRFCLRIFQGKLLSCSLLQTRKIKRN